GIPSTTYKGADEALIEPFPLICTLTGDPGCPFDLETLTPGAFPCILWIGFSLGVFSNCSELTLEIELVSFSCSTSLYPVTTISSPAIVWLSNSISSSVLPLMGTSLVWYPI